MPRRAGSAWITVQSSGPRSRPVSASRNARRSPPAAFNSRTVSRASPSTSSLKRSIVGFASAGSSTGSGSRICLRVLARFLEISSSAHRGNERLRYANPRGELLVRHGGDRLDSEAPDAREIELHVVLRQAELVEVRPHRLRGQARVAQIGDRRHRVPLGELAALRPQYEPDVHVLRRLPAERLGQLAVQGLVRTVVRPADDVRDLELDVVHDGREVVRRRAVRSKQRRLAEAIAHPGARRQLGIDPGARSAAPAPRPRRCRATRGRGGSPALHPPRCVTDPCRRSVSRNQSPNARLAAAVSALPTWSEPVGWARSERGA